MQKQYLLIGALLLLFFPALAPAETPPPEAVAAAEAGLVKFLTEVIPPSELVNFGFAEGEAVAEARVGEPWLLYTITPDALRGATEETAVEDIVTPTGLWFFPVILGGRARSILTVALMDGQWEAVGLGKAPLAAELDKISARWPKANGYTPKLVAVYQATAYFFTVPEQDSSNLTPLTFDGIGFGGWRQKAGSEYSATAELSALLAPLKEAVEANIAGHRTFGEGGGE
jgi:hypothetical protein